VFKEKKKQGEQWPTARRLFFCFCFLTFFVSSLIWSHSVNIITMEVDLVLLHVNINFFFLFALLKKNKTLQTK